MDTLAAATLASDPVERADSGTVRLRLMASTQLRLVLRAWLARGASLAMPPEIDFGSAARLTDRLRAGAAVDVALFADIAAAQAVLPTDAPALPLARDRLVLVARPDLRLTAVDLVERLQSATLRLGSALTDAGQEGDPAERFFALIDQRHPGAGTLLRSRARPLLVRGEPPSHRQVMEMLVSGQMDVVLGSYSALRTLSEVAEVLAPPDMFAVDIVAGAAILANGGPRRAAACRFVAALRAPDGQAMLLRHGFDSVAGPLS